MRPPAGSAAGIRSAQGYKVSRGPSTQGGVRYLPSAIGPENGGLAAPSNVSLVQRLGILNRQARLCPHSLPLSTLSVSRVPGQSGLEQSTVRLLSKEGFFVDLTPLGKSLYQPPPIGLPLQRGVPKFLWQKVKYSLWSLLLNQNYICFLFANKISPPTLRKHRQRAPRGVLRAVTWHKRGASAGGGGLTLTTNQSEAKP